VNRKILSVAIITTIAITILFSVLLSFNSPSLAQVSSQVIPRIEAIEGSEGIPPSYRLVITDLKTMFMFSVLLTSSHS
jgi:hypothetical protein